MLKRDLFTREHYLHLLWVWKCMVPLGCPAEITELRSRNGPLTTLTNHIIPQSSKCDRHRHLTIQQGKRSSENLVV